MATVNVLAMKRAVAFWSQALSNKVQLDDSMRWQAAHEHDAGCWVVLGGVGGCWVVLGVEWVLVGVGEHADESCVRNRT